MQVSTSLPSSSSSSQRPPLRRRSSRGLRFQMMLGLSLVSLLVAAVAAGSLWGLFAMRAAARQAVEIEGQLSQLSSQVAIYALQCRRYEKDIFLNVNDPRERADYMTNWQRANGDLEAAIDAFATLTTTPEDRRQATLWRTAHTLYVEGFEQVKHEIASSRISSPEQADTAFDPFRENITTLTDLAVLVSEQKAAVARQTASTLRVDSSRVIMLVAGAALLAVTVALGWSLMFPSVVTRPLAILRDAAVRLADGDLSVRVGSDRSDELGALAQSFDRMATTIEHQMGDLTAQYAAASLARDEAEAARRQSAEQLALIESQRALISEMSVPILPLTGDILVMPLVGSLEGNRLGTVRERALEAIERSRARYLILDITGVPIVDTSVAQGLIQVTQAARLLGTQVILVGIRPEVAQAVVGLGISLSSVITRSTLQAGLDYTLHHAKGVH